MAAASCEDDTILMLLPDGGVRMFSAARPGDPPLLVSDVLAELPNCRVCRLDSPSSSPGRSPCLSPHAALRPGTTYFLVEPMTQRVDPGYCGFDPVTMEPVKSVKGSGAEPFYRPKSAGAGGEAGQFPDFMETAGGYFPSGAQPGQYYSHSRNTSLSSCGTSNSGSSSNSSSGVFGMCGSDTSSGSRRLTRGLTSPAAMGSVPVGSAAAHHSGSFREQQMPYDAPELLDISAVAARAAAAYGGNASPVSGMAQTGPFMCRTASWSAASTPGWTDAYGAAPSYETGAHDASPSRSSLDLDSPPQMRSRHVSAEDAALDFIKQHNATTSSASRRYHRAPLPPRCSAQQQSPREQQTAADVLAAGASGRLRVQRSSSTRNKIVSLEDIVYGRVTS
ncbi:unnamed protein product [Closterium sp. NIES-53]